MEQSRKYTTKASFLFNIEFSFNIYMYWHDADFGRGLWATVSFCTYKLVSSINLLNCLHFH